MSLDTAQESFWAVRVLQTGGLLLELRTPLGPACTPATQPYRQLCRHVVAPPGGSERSGRPSGGRAV
jgi:hypothetical protein